MMQERNKPEQPRDGKLPAADTGNASNPSPDNKEQKVGNQLLDKKAEKYLREAGNIEDLPDAQDQQEIEESMNKG